MPYLAIMFKLIATLPIDAIVSREITIRTRTEFALVLGVKTPLLITLLYELRWNLPTDDDVKTGH